MCEFVSGGLDTGRTGHAAIGANTQIRQGALKQEMGCLLRIE